MENAEYMPIQDIKHKLAVLYKQARMDMAELSIAMDEAENKERFMCLHGMSLGASIKTQLLCRINGVLESAEALGISLEDILWELAMMDE